MAEDNEVSKRKGRDPILMIGTIVLVLAFVVVVSGYAYGQLVNTESNEPAKYGSNVKVDYVGSFYGWYDEGGTVFDTSLRSVASNESIPKSWEFVLKENPAPLSVTIGNGRALAEFERALIGMKPGETKRIMIEEGYGPVPAASERDWKMTDTMQYKEEMSASVFKDTFGLANASPGRYVDLDHPYGWKSEARFNSSGTVTVTHLVENKTYTMNDYMDVEVTLNATDFDIEFFIDAVADPTGDPTAVKLIEFKYGGQRFYITNVDAGVKFTTKSTNEITGMNLYFVITFLGY